METSKTERSPRTLCPFQQRTVVSTCCSLSRATLLLLLALGSSCSGINCRQRRRCSRPLFPGPSRRIPVQPRPAPPSLLPRRQQLQRPLDPVQRLLKRVQAARVADAQGARAPKRLPGDARHLRPCARHRCVSRVRCRGMGQGGAEGANWRPRRAKQWSAAAAAPRRLSSLTAAPTQKRAGISLINVSRWRAWMAHITVARVGGAPSPSRGCTCTGRPCPRPRWGRSPARRSL